MTFPSKIGQKQKQIDKVQNVGKTLHKIIEFQIVVQGQVKKLD